MKKQRKNKIASVGLKDYTEQEIKDLIKKYESEGWRVSHIKEGLPYNGILRLEK